MYMEEFSPMKWEWVSQITLFCCRSSIIVLCLLTRIYIIIIGKTIQAISLILYNRPNLEDKEQMTQWNLADQQHEAGETKSKDSTVVALPESKPTKGKKGSSSTTSKASKEIVVSSSTTPRAGIHISLMLSSISSSFTYS